MNLRRSTPTLASTNRACYDPLLALMRLARIFCYLFSLSIMPVKYCLCSRTCLMAFFSLVFVCMYFKNGKVPQSMDFGVLDTMNSFFSPWPTVLTVDRHPKA